MSMVKPFNTRPLYQQVADEFIARIVSRRWAPGQAIENESEIARSLGISLGTVRKAFDILSEYKLLERHQGKGTIVTDHDAPLARGRFTNLVDRSGQRVSGEITLHDVTLETPEPRVAEAMGVNARTPIVRFERRRSHLGRVFMHEDVYLRVGASAQSVSQEQLEQIAASRWFGQDLATRMIEEVAADTPNQRDLERFGRSRIGAVLTLRRIVLSYQDRPLELRFARCDLGSDLTYLAR